MARRHGIYDSDFRKNLIIYVVSVIEMLLGVRFVLRIVSANPENPFAKLIYEVSDYLVFPFDGLFPPEVVGQVNEIDFSAFTALFVYPLIAFVFIYLNDLFTKKPRY